MPIRKLYWRSACAVVLLAWQVVIGHGQTFTTLVNFNRSNGAGPRGQLVQGGDGNFYGTTSQGGATGAGTVFKVTPGGTLTTLYSFSGGSDGGTPYAGLIQASDGNLYGTTRLGGANATGTIFKITPGGALMTIHSFGPNEGAAPDAGLIQASDGNFYGTTSAGGATSTGTANGSSTIFRISPAGLFTILYSFTDARNGAGPEAGLIQATDGSFYGTTSTEGSVDEGTVFKMTPAGILTTIYSFTGVNDGGESYAGLVQGTDGNFYGTTSMEGGPTATGGGTIFRITPGGTLSQLHSFTLTGVDGAQPRAGLIQATDGNLYGTTFGGGQGGSGTIFQITTGGTLTTLHSFNLPTDGGAPLAGLIQGVDGYFYGTTSQGGSNGQGTVFRLQLTLRPSSPVIASVVNDAGFMSGGAISSGSWVAIFGSDLAPAGDSRMWNTSTEIVNDRLPTSLDGTSVTVNGKSAVVEFIQPSQVNIQPPDDTAIGPVQVVVTTAAGASNSFTANYATFAPGLFPAASPYIVAQHADSSYVTSTAPAKPGEVIVLWGTGFGPANPAVPAGQVFSGVTPLANTVSITIGGQPAAVDFAGVVGAGLVQINVHVPSSISNGDAGVVAMVGGVSSQTTGNMISIHN